MRGKKKMIKTTKTILVALALLLAMPLTMAQTDIANATGQENGMREIMPFETVQGAEMRLLQLERAIHMNIVKGETMIDAIRAEADEETIEELEAILLALVDLKEEVSEYELVGEQEDVEAFVSFRQEASALSKEFRDAAREVITEDRAQIIRNEAQGRAEQAMAATNYQENIRERANEHNEEIVKRAMEDQGIINEDFEDLLERIRNRDIEPRDIRTEVMSLVREIRSEQANEILANLREEAMRQEINARENINRINEEVLQNKTEIARQRIQEIKDRIPEDVVENISEIINNLGERIPFRGGMQ